MVAQVMMDSNAHTVLVFEEGRGMLRAVCIRRTVRVARIYGRDRAALRPMLYKGQPYPVKRAVRLLRKAGRTLGITKGAKVELARLSGLGAA